MVDLSDQAFGSAVSLSGALFLLPDTLLIRLTGHLPACTVNFYRFFFFATSILMFSIATFQERLFSQIVSIGLPGLGASVMSGLSNLLFISAVQSTSVASTLVLVSSAPVFSAIFSYALLKEAIPRRTIATSLISIVAVVVVFCDELVDSRAPDTRAQLLGKLSAVGSAASFAMMLVLLRSARSDHVCGMIPINALAGYLICMYCLAVEPPSTQLSATDTALLLCQGCLTLFLSQICLTIGPAYVPAAEVSLYMTLETIFAPVIVWVGGFEAPPRLTVVGGTILLTALCVNNVLALKEEAARASDDRNAAYNPLGIDEEGSPEQYSPGHLGEK